MPRKLMLAKITALCAAFAAQVSSLAIERPCSKAIYFQRANPAGETVVAIGVGHNGLLQNRSSITSTKGVGRPEQLSTNPADGPFAPNPLASQDSVIVDGNYLFTVNTGSNTAVVFEINPADPLELRMIGGPVSTIGTYPASIAYSAIYRTACVINGGVTNGVACFYFDPVRGLIPDGQGLRNTHLVLGPEPIHNGPLGSASDIKFAPDSSSLIAVFKGNTTPTAETAPIFVFDVLPNGEVSTISKNASNPLLSFDFGFVYDPANYSNVYITDANYGGVFMNINPVTGASTTLSVNSNTTNQLGSCWVVYSELKNAFYEISIASPTVAVVNPETGALEDAYPYENGIGTPTAPLGGIDTTINENLLYFIRAVSNTITVVNVDSKEVVQQFNYSTIADRAYWGGLAFYNGF